MAKYHINIHGEPVRCPAQQKCRVKTAGGEHFEGTLRQAVDWAEAKNAEEAGGGSFGSASKSTTNHTSDVSSDDYNGSIAPQSYETTSQDDDDEDYYEDKMDDHSSQDLLLDAVSSNIFRTDHSPEDFHYSINAGKINPTSKGGSGSEFLSGTESMVIMSDYEGKGVRAISSSGEMYPEPEEYIGKSVTQVKQQRNRDAKKSLIVVGYVSSNGEKTGHVPDRQVSMFVYK